MVQQDAHILALWADIVSIAMVLWSGQARCPSCLMFRGRIGGPCDFRFTWKRGQETEILSSKSTWTFLPLATTSSVVMGEVGRLTEIIGECQSKFGERLFVIGNRNLPPRPILPRKTSVNVDVSDTHLLPCPPRHSSSGKSTSMSTPVSISPPAAASTNKDFACGICGKRFSRRENLHRHGKTRKRRELQLTSFLLIT
jgi:hypothetical protein